MARHGNRIRILFIITSTGLGGSEKALLERSLRMDRSKYHLHFCSLRPKGPIADQLEDKGWPVTSFNMGTRCSVNDFISGTLRLAALIRRLHVDIVHSFLHRANVMTRLAAHMVHPRPVVMSTEEALALGRTALIPVANRLTWRLSDQIIVNAEAVREQIIRRQGVVRRRVQVIYYGIEPTHFDAGGDGAARRRYFPEASVVIATLSRLSPEKGLSYLIRALEMVRPRHPQLRLLICGDGPERVRLERLSSELGLGSMVRFTGSLWPFPPENDVVKALSEADIFCLPSLEEGMPGVVMEAMAARCPVVASAVGGVAELVENGVTGLLVPPANPEVLGAALSKLAADYELRLRMGDSGRRRVERHFGINDTVTRMCRLYDDLIERSSSRQAAARSP